MKKTISIMILFAIIAKISGFIRDIILAYNFGTTRITDIFLISMVIPTVIFNFIGAGINVGFIPIYNRIKSNSDKLENENFLNNIITITMGMCTFIIIIILFNINSVIKMFAIGFDSDMLYLSRKFTSISIFGIYFSVLCSIFISLLQVEGYYSPINLISIPYNIILIFCIILGNKINIYFLPVGIFLGLVAQFIYLNYYLKKINFHYKFKFNIFDSNFKDFIRTAIPATIGVSVNQINVLIDRSIASGIEIGGISILSYANRVNLFAQVIIVNTILSYIFPLISRAFESKDHKSFKNYFEKSVLYTSLIVIPATSGLIILAEPIITLIFKRGAFNQESVILTSSSLIFYSLGMIGASLRELYSRVFYSTHDVKTPMINASVGVIVNVILNIILSHNFGLKGLALATSISSLFTAFLLHTQLKRKFNLSLSKSIKISIIKIIIATIFMSFIVFYSKLFLFRKSFNSLNVIILSLLGFLIFLFTLYIFKFDEIIEIKQFVKNKFKK